ncbi:hypothetical protein QJQ45_010047 [Haematococcus lacustris]|nr:hypothetical protein QJQ45_010047 [Haematococcus lacustris]
MPMFDQKRDDKHWDDECLTLLCSFAPDSVMQLCTLGKKLSVKMLNEYCKAVGLLWDTVHREEPPSKSAWHVTCKRCPWTASINSVTRVAQHISGSTTDVKKCTAPDPEMVQLVRQHDAAAASSASSTHKRRGEDGMEPSPSRQRASRNASQDVVTKEMIDDTRRTSMLLRPLHGAAALLDPEYRQHFNMRGESSAGQLDFQAVLPDFMKVAEKLSPTSAAECVVQLPKYLHATTAMAAATAKSMSPHEWHRIHTGGALGALAMKVTSQVASATSCERAWSSYGFVHNPRRNRLTASNAEMLTQLYFNSRLLKRAGKGVASKAWEWQREQGDGEGEGEGEGEEEGEGEGEELLQRLQAINEDALEAAVEADLAKETARVAALEAEALALALST